MKYLLFLSPYFPYPLDCGGKKRIYHLIEHLSQKYKIILLSFCATESVDFENISQYCKKIYLVKKKKKNIIKRILNFLSIYPAGYYAYFDKEYLNKIFQILEEFNDEKFVIWFEEEVLICYEKYLKNHKKYLSLQKLLSEHLYLLSKYHKNYFFRIYYFIEYIKYFYLEKKYFKNYDKIIVISRKEQNKVKKIHNTDIEVIPYNFKIKQFSFDKKIKYQSELLFVGNMYYYPNLDAVVYFIEKILPEILKENNQVIFNIVGRVGEKIKNQYENKNVKFLGYVENLYELLKKNYIFVAPLRITGGASIKIIEAVEVGMTAICTPNSRNGLDIEDKNNIIVADIDKFAEKILSLIKFKLNEDNFRR